MAKQKADLEKNPNRQPQPMTAEDLATTARLFDSYARKFEALANVMKERSVAKILATNGPSVKDAIRRLDKHYDSCRSALGFLVVGEMMPNYSFEKPPQEPN